MLDALNVNFIIQEITVLGRKKSLKTSQVWPIDFYLKRCLITEYIKQHCFLYFL